MNPAELDAADRPPKRPCAGPRPRAGRQIDLPSRSDPGGADGRRNHHRRPAGRRGRPAYRRRHAGARRSCRAHRRAGLAHSRRRRRRVSPSRRARSISAIPARAAGWPLARWPAAPVTATFDGDASLRSRPMRRVLDPLEKMGARVARGRRWRTAAADAARRRRPDPDRLRAAGSFGAAQIGGAARRACRAGRDDRDRGGSDPRPHRAVAETFRRQDHQQAAWRAWPPHRVARVSPSSSRQCRGAGRSVFGGVSAGRGADRARLRT